MSDANILAALDGWLGSYSQATTAMPVVTKPVNPVSTVAKVVAMETLPISDWENLINWWLDHIGEDDSLLRNTCLDQCRRDAEARRYFLSHAILEFSRTRKTQNEVNHD